MRKIILLATAFVVFSFLFVELVISASNIKWSSKPPSTGDWVAIGKCANGKVEWLCTNCPDKERQPKKPTPTPTPPQPNSAVSSSLKPDPQWTSVLGYTASFNQCSNLCVQYQQSGCNSQYAMNYCNTIVSLDLNKNGKISASEIGSTPSGTRNCETNARCYDVIPSCECGNQPLNIASCVNLLYQTYTKTGLSLFQALQNVAQQTTSGCNPPQS